MLVIIVRAVLYAIEYYKAERKKHLNLEKSRAKERGNAMYIIHIMVYILYKWSYVYYTHYAIYNIHAVLLSEERDIS